MDAWQGVMLQGGPSVPSPGCGNLPFGERQGSKGPGFPPASDSSLLSSPKAARSGFSGLRFAFGKGEDAGWSVIIQLYFSSLNPTPTPSPPSGFSRQPVFGT